MTSPLWIQNLFNVASNTGLHYPTLAAYRAAPVPPDGSPITILNPPKSLVYSAATGTGWADDGTTIIRQTATPTGNGVAYPTAASSVAPTLAALRAMVSGKQQLVHVLSHSAYGDHGERDFHLDPSDVTSADDGGTVIVVNGNRYKCSHINGRYNVCWWGAWTNGDVGIQAAIDAAPLGSLGSQKGPWTLVHPRKPGGYQIANTIVISNHSGLKFVFDGASANNEDYYYTWIGAAGQPVVLFTGACAGIDIGDLSVDCMAGAYRALCGIAIGSVTGVTSSMQSFKSGRVQIRRGRFGVMIGNPTIDSADIAVGTFARWNIQYCTDAGVLVQSGNAACQKFVGCYFMFNGANPTTDAMNPNGFGANCMLVGGDVTMIANTTAGLGDGPTGRPATADIIQYYASLKVYGHWGEAQGPLLVQGFGDQLITTVLDGIRHFGILSDADTPSSMILNGHVLLTNSYFFGDIVHNTGAGGTLTEINNRFQPAPSTRPTLGQGRFKGTTVKGAESVVSICSQSNQTGITVGSLPDDPSAPNTSRDFYVGVGLTQPPKILALGNLHPVLQGIASALTGSAWTMSTNDDGSVQFLINTYLVGANWWCLQTGNAYILTLGSNGGITIQQAWFSAPSTHTAWTSVYGTIQPPASYGSAYAGMIALRLPSVAGLPSFSASDYYKGGLAFDPTALAAAVNIGGTSGWRYLLMEGGPLKQAMDCGNFGLTNMSNGGSTVDLALSSDAVTSFPIKTLNGLAASHKFTATLGVRIVQYADSDHTIAGSIDITTDVNIVTDGSSVATVTIPNTIVPDVSRLPSGLAGATATVTAATGGIVVYATRKAGTAGHARYHYWLNYIEDVT